LNFFNPCFVLGTGYSRLSPEVVAEKAQATSLRGVRQLPDDEAISISGKAKPADQMIGRCHYSTR